MSTGLQSSNHTKCCLQNPLRRWWRRELYGPLIRIENIFFLAVHKCHHKIAIWLKFQNVTPFLTTHQGSAEFIGCIIESDPLFIISPSHFWWDFQWMQAKELQKILSFWLQKHESSSQAEPTKWHHGELMPEDLIQGLIQAKENQGDQNLAKAKKPDKSQGGAMLMRMQTKQKAEGQA